MEHIGIVVASNWNNILLSLILFYIRLEAYTLGISHNNGKIFDLFYILNTYINAYVISLNKFFQMHLKYHFNFNNKIKEKFFKKN